MSTINCDLQMADAVLRAIDRIYQVEQPLMLVRNNPLKNFWFSRYFDKKGSSSFGREGSGVLDTEGARFRKVDPVNTLEAFFRVFPTIAPVSSVDPEICSTDFAFFKEGCSTKWEHPLNMNGGRWIFFTHGKSPEELDVLWEKLCKAVISSTFCCYVNDITGAIISIRKEEGGRICLWTGDAANERKQLAIGRRFKSVLNVPAELVVTYEGHFIRDKDTAGVSHRTHYFL